MLLTKLLKQQTCGGRPPRRPSHLLHGLGEGLRLHLGPARLGRFCGAHARTEFDACVSMYARIVCMYIQIHVYV